MQCDYICITDQRFHWPARCENKADQRNLEPIEQSHIIRYGMRANTVISSAHLNQVVSAARRAFDGITS